MGGGQRQSSPQRGKAESEHENPFAQALYVSLTHSTKNKKRSMEKEGLRRVRRCSLHSLMLLHAAVQPTNTRGHGDRGGLAAGTQPWEARHAPGIHPPPLDGLGLLQQHGPSQQDRKKSHQQ